MTHQTKIEWCDFTVNFWEGCQKVGPGCDHCYAEARDQRFTGRQHWGPHAPRRKVKSGVSKLLGIQGKAQAFRAEHGHWPRVFCSSLSDVFDNAVDKSWQIEAFATIHACSDTRVILLTKRVGNVFQMIPPSWASRELGGWPKHVGLMITVVNQEEADRDIPKLLDLKARMGIPWVGLSMEPLLGLVDLRLRDDGVPLNRWGLPLGPCGYYCSEEHGHVDHRTRLDWIIVGGESGHHARPMHPDWARSLRDQCSAAGVPFLFKQWGEWVTSLDRDRDDPDWRADYINNYVDRGKSRWLNLAGGRGFHGERFHVMARVGKARAGRLLDGRTWDQFPEALS